ncbi:unnamed protein product [Protopolystoma xenopodis]|uniref:Uncharacterized protein n=1 Tax=Protopolystoma xenopodis TaxID=117903 RepID=A0A448XDD5_9PLAT|nr:unnamed protein product [Protopolystoma xenopodis]
MVFAANQAMAALVCCGPIYDPVALLSNAFVTYGHAGSSSCVGPTASSGSQIASGTWLISHVPTSIDCSAAISIGTGAGLSISCLPTSFSGTGSTSGLISTGYVLRWLAGLLSARDALLDSSPWLWRCPVVGMGLLAESFAQEATSAAVGAGSFMRSPVIAYGGGRRLDTLIRQLGEETLVLLLELNPGLPGLLEWVVDKCYTAANPALTEACFVAVFRILTHNMNYPCDSTSLLTLSLVFMEHSKLLLRERAFYLFQLLYYRFIVKSLLVQHDAIHRGTPSDQPHNKKRDSAAASSGDVPSSHEMHAATQNTAQGIRMCSFGKKDGQMEPCSELCHQVAVNLQFWRCLSASWTLVDVSRQFAAQHPEYTLFVFSGL